jgi:hypothetical protein
VIGGIRSPDRPARSESLYRLSYPVPRRTVAFINTVELGYNVTKGTEYFVSL